MCEVGDPEGFLLLATSTQITAEVSVWGQGGSLPWAACSKPRLRCPKCEQKSLSDQKAESLITVEQIQTMKVNLHHPSELTFKEIPELLHDKEFLRVLSNADSKRWLWGEINHFLSRTNSCSKCSQRQQRGIEPGERGRRICKKSRKSQGTTETFHSSIKRKRGLAGETGPAYLVEASGA